MTVLDVQCPVGDHIVETDVAVRCFGVLHCEVYELLFLREVMVFTVGVWQIPFAHLFELAALNVELEKVYRIAVSQRIVVTTVYHEARQLARQFGRYEPVQSQSLQVIIADKEPVLASALVMKFAFVAKLEIPAKLVAELVHYCLCSRTLSLPLSVVGLVLEIALMAHRLVIASLYLVVSSLHLVFLLIVTPVIHPSVVVLHRPLLHALELGMEEGAGSILQLVAFATEFALPNVTWHHF